MMPTHAIGFLGTSLDNGFARSRWLRWRPSVALCLHDDLLIDVYHVIYDPKFERLFDVVRRDIRQVSPTTEVIGHTLHFNNPWDFADVYQGLYDFVKGFTFAPEHRYLLHLTTGTHVAQICWFLLVEAGFIPAHLIQTSPCPKDEPATVEGRYQIIDLDVSRYDSIRERFEAERIANWQTLQANLITANPRYQRLIADIEKVATRSTAPILLMGATGAGKSQLAKQIYALKEQVAKSRGQALGAFVEVNCATLRGDTAMSVLFGHVKGAFTGAVSAREGLLRRADGGVLFLDEIGELGGDEQAMLLTALESQRFYPLGSDTPVTVQVQLLAGTNKDLRQAVANGTFRADLFARINTWVFFLPSLKDRTEDIPVNIDYELARIGTEAQAQYRFEATARRRYEAFATSAEAAWTGNFRDLSASISRMTTLADSHVIRVEDVEAEIARLRHLWALSAESSLSVSPTSSPAALTNIVPSAIPEATTEPIEKMELAEVETQARTTQALTKQSMTAQIKQAQALLVPLVDAEVLSTLDPVEAVQLAYVVQVCRMHANQAEAGRALYAQSRQRLKNPNDSDRLGKYLKKYGLRFEKIRF